jgi:hypothetical protein
VSLPWSKTVRLRVVPDSVCAVLEQGWLRPTALARAGQGTRAAATPDSPMGESTRASADELAHTIDAVLAELAQTSTLRGARLEVELADSLLLFDVVSGDYAGDSERQLQAVANACVAELLGDAAPAHEVRWHLQADGKHLLIGAIASDLLHAVSEAAARQGLRLGSVQPDFCLQWNHHAAALRAGAAVFVVASGRDAVVACVANGSVAGLSSGGWLDRNDAAGTAIPNVNRLMCGLGIEASATTGLLDFRVDRLLASIGQDAASQSAFVLVAPELSPTGVSPRWTVLNREAGVSCG